MSDVSIVNVVILGVLAIGAITGGMKGFVRQMIELVGLVVSFFVAAVIASWLAEQLSKIASVPHAPALVIAFLAVFVAGLVAFHFVAISAQRIAHMSLFGWVDRLCGALVGLLAGTLVASVFATVLLELPVPDDVRSALERSSVCAFVQPVAPWLFKAVFPQDREPVAAQAAVLAAVPTVVT